jgi:outer membrane immunogenic protein
MRGKLLSLAGAFAMIGGTSAMAADLYIPPAPPEPIAVAFNWSGGYIGAQAGFGWGRHTRIITPAVFTNVYNSRGFIAGVHAGWNHQTGNFVVGIEGDLNFTSISGNDAGVGGSTDATRIRWAGTANLRFGRAWDRTLLYLTGGLALASANQTNSLAVLNNPTRTLVGFNVGAGIDYAFTDRLVGRIGYRFKRYGTEAYTGAGLNPFTVQTQTHEVTAGLSILLGR